MKPIHKEHIIKIRIDETNKSFIKHILQDILDERDITMIEKIAQTFYRNKTFNIILNLSSKEITVISKNSFFHWQSTNKRGGV